MSAVKLAAEPDVQLGAAGAVPAATLALAGESRFAWTVTTEPPGAGAAAGTAGLPAHGAAGVGGPAQLHRR